MALDLASTDIADRLMPGVRYAESGDTPAEDVPATNRGRDVGPYQISPGALDDVNRAFGTNYTMADRADEAKGRDIARKYLTLQVQRFGPRVGLEAYNAGPTRVAAGDVPQSSADYAARVLNIGGAGNIDQLMTDFPKFKAMLGTPDSSWLAPTMASLQASGVAERAELEGIEREQSGLRKRDVESVEKARTEFDAASKADTTPWNKPPPERDALQGFASAGSIFAAIASMFTRTPAISAMNGMAAAINARREGNEKAYNEAYKVWQDNTKLAIDRQKIASDRLNQALELMKTDSADGFARARQVMLEHGDERGLVMLQAGMYKELYDANAARDQVAAQLAIQYNRLGGYGMTMTREQAVAVEDYLRQHPEASRLDAIRAVTGAAKAGGKETGPQYINRRIDELNKQRVADGKPPFSPEEEGNLRATFGGKRALSEKDLDSIEVHAATVNEALTKLQTLDDIMARTGMVAGGANKVLGPTESVGNILEFTSDTDRRDFQSAEAWLKENAPVLLKHANPTSRTIASDQAQVDQIIRGGNWGDTYYNVQSSIKDMRRMFGNDLSLLQQQTQRGTGAPLSLPGQTLPGQTPAAPAAPAAPAWQSDPISQ